MSERKVRFSTRSTRVYFVKHSSGVIETPGIDFSGKITVEAEMGNRQVWRKNSGTYWCGNYMPRGYSPVEYWLVEIESDGKHANIIASAEGRGANQILKEFKRSDG